MSFDVAAVRNILCDLDGVVWLAHRPIPGAVEAIERLRASGRSVLFVTNNSASTTAEHERALAQIGISATGDVVSSSHAAAATLSPGERVLIGGAAGVAEAVASVGAEPVAVEDHLDPLAPAPRVDAVVVGLHREFDYQRMRVLSTAIRNGARFVATNDDPTYPTPEGLVPGNGSIVASVATAAGTEPLIAGKPHRPMADAVRSQLAGALTADNTLMVGDRWSTDGRFAQALGCRFALVRSGVTTNHAALELTADLDVADLAALADLLLDAG